MTGSSLEELANAVAKDVTNGAKVALGFECPLYVPLRDDPMLLTKARTGQGNRSWSAGAGCGALATGHVEVTWLLERIRTDTPGHFAAFLDWKSFEMSEGGIFLWEAFVSGKAKGNGHAHDAEIAAPQFLAALPNPELENAIPEKKCSRSLARVWCGLAGLQTSNFYQNPALSSRHNSAVDPIRSTQSTAIGDSPRFPVFEPMLKL